MKQLNRGKIMVLVAMLSQIIALGLPSIDASRICQLVSIVFLVFALLVMRKPKRKKRKTQVRPPKQVDELLDKAKRS